MSQQKVNLDQFNAQQLYQIRQGFQNQINTLNQSLNQFRYAMQKYEQGRRAIRAAQDCKPQEQLLIPLSNALYIEGYLNNIKDGSRVYLIQYGAGFFVQRNAKQAIEFYLRKINLIKQKIQKLQSIINQKRQGARQCQLKIMAMLQLQQQQSKQ